MGKNNNNNKNKRKQMKMQRDQSSKTKKRKIDQNHGEHKGVVVLDQHVSPVQEVHHSQHVKKNNNKMTSLLLPLAFPHDKGLILPKDDFLKCVHPYKESFQRAIDTSYEGFAVDEGPTGISSMASNRVNPPLFNHEAIQQALAKMEGCGLFRTDVTQPFGLGTRCAKTYVTRCLLGDEGTTYKYLGLRMFAHPWSVNGKPSSGHGIGSLDEALKEISKLNEKLTERTKHHLNDLEKKRNGRLGFRNGQSYISGRAKFDVALINRMINSPDLKLEPTQKKDKCSVSWHADSSLEHYSSIGVYQTIISDNNKDGKDFKKKSTDEAQKQMRENELAKRWSVALRVAHDSEGPAASRRGTNIDAAVVNDTPPISVSLPSRSAYYLLDDFNHHHQHAVLVDNDNDQHVAGVRYASTHRLLRESHNVNFVLERCKSACSQFHRKGAKIWRSEQVLQMHIESEWIRQFYIQGQGHKDNLWKYWKMPLCQLLKYWSQFESRTKQVIDLLSNAAMARCGMNEKHNGGEVPSRVERKQKERQKKALIVVEDLMKRASDGATRIDVTEALYEPICVLLAERAKMRSLFLARENDWLFQSMPPGYKPLTVPFNFESDTQTSKNAEAGFSPLVGTSEELMALTNTLRQYGKAYTSRNISDLPNRISCRQSKVQETDKIVVKMPSSSDSVEAPKAQVKGKKQSGQDKDSKPSGSGLSIVANENRQAESMKPQEFLPRDHQNDITWKGWQSIRIGLEMQEPWGGLLLDGKKTIETRAYALPKALIGRRIDILQSKSGSDGFSGLSNVMVGAEITGSVERIGWCIIEKVVVYRYKSKFESDEKKHLVQRDSGYGWKDDTNAVYGWVVGNHGKYKRGKSKHKEVTCLIRRMRSLFEIQT